MDDDDWVAPTEFGTTGKIISFAAIVAVAVGIYLFKPKPTSKQHPLPEFEIKGIGWCAIGHLHYRSDYWICVKH